MARCYGLRLGLIAGMLTFCVGTTATTASTYDQTGYSPTASTTDSYGSIVISFNIYQPEFVLPAFIERQATIKRDFPSYSAPHISERASRSAVRPTAVSGWRSGRVRHLAAA